MTGLDAKMAELAARFDARAADERQTLATALASEDRDAIVGMAHRLAGIAGMFRRDEIGAAALALEEAAEAGHDLAVPAARLDTLLARLID